MQCVRLLLLAAFIASWHSVLCIPAGKVRTAAPTTAKPTAATPATKGTPATSTGTPAATKASGSAATGTAATAKKAPEEPESSLEVVGDAKWTAHFKHIFHNIDSNKDKTVNRQELKRQIEQIEKDFLSKIKHDEHEDQAASEALHDEMENEDDASVKAEAEKFFDEELDVKKKDGILTVDELKLLNDGKAGLPEHLQDHDVNADGKVTRKEYIDTEVNLRDMFEKTTTKEFKHIDTNSDGKVDSNEWAHGLVFDGLTQTEIAEEKALEGGMYEFEMERFNEADVNIDGHLDAAEYQLAQMLYQRGVDGSEEDHQATVNKAYDEFSRLTKGQKEPKVSFDQFAQTEIFSGEKRSLEESKKHADGVYALEHARWKKVDADHDGFLNKLEFAAYSMEDFGQHLGWVGEEVDRIMTEHDGDHDGVLSLDELVASMAHQGNMRVMTGITPKDEKEDGKDDSDHHPDPSEDHHSNRPEGYDELTDEEWKVELKKLYLLMDKNHDQHLSSDEIQDQLRHVERVMDQHESGAAQADKDIEEESEDIAGATFDEMAHGETVDWAQLKTMMGVDEAAIADLKSKEHDADDAPLQFSEDDEKEFKRLDADGDGRVTRAQFIQFFGHIEKKVYAASAAGMPHDNLSEERTTFLEGIHGREKSFEEMSAEERSSLTYKEAEDTLKPIMEDRELKTDHFDVQLTKWDKDANKRLNYLEYLAILHNFDDAARDKVKQEFKAMGATSDLVTFDQYLTAKVYVGDKARMEKDKKNPRSVYTHELSLLKSVDNGDGKLAPEEYFVYHNNYVKQIKENAGFMLESFDKDKDGKISLEEVTHADADDGDDEEKQEDVSDLLTQLMLPLHMTHDL